MSEERISRPMNNGLIFAIALFELLSFCLLAMKDGALDTHALVFSLACVGLLLLQFLLFRFVFRKADLQVLIIASVLSAIGLIVQYRLSPATAQKQLTWYMLAIAAMFLVMTVLPKLRQMRRFDLFFVIAAIGLLSLAAFFGVSKNGSSNWFSIGGLTFQPSEPVKVLLVLILAGELSKNLSIRKLVPVGLFVGACMLLLVIQKDLGAALLYFGTAMILLYLGTGNLPVTFAAFGAGAGGAVLSYFLFDHVKTRVTIWRDPWNDPLGSGYQLVQSLIAIASGGLFGMGLGVGSAQDVLPQYDTDFVFSVICEDFGQIIAVCVILFYIVLAFRGCIIALRAKTRFDALLAFGSVTMLALQTFIIIGGVIQLIPLTGVTLPFISYGGSSMVTSMIFIGILEGVAIRNGGGIA